ncbi:MAG: sulfite exporter TauE/SafE family protein [Planctomycetota bacterium]
MPEPMLAAIATDSGAGLAIALAIGLVAGAVGGIAGIGGSIVMLPALGLIFGYAATNADGPTPADRHHLYMAAAMIVNAVVAIASLRQHAKAKATDAKLTRWLLPSMIAGIVLGVVLSDRFDGRIPKVGLACFLIVVCAWWLYSAWKDLPDRSEANTKHRPAILAILGGGTGILAGFLGIGGGIVLVPTLQLLASVPIRKAVAASTSVMWVTASVGASIKLFTLRSHGQEVSDALALGAPMGLGALVGASVGARLVHVVPQRALRAIIGVVLAVAGARMAGFM